MLESMRFGQRRDDLSAAHNESLLPSWGCALRLLADALGVERDDIALAAGSYPAPADYISAVGTRIAARTVGGLQWSLTGVPTAARRSWPTTSSRMGEHMAPD